MRNATRIGAPKIVEIQVTFLCDSGHEISRQFTHVQSHLAMRNLETQEFSVDCPVYGWTEKRLGSQRHSGFRSLG